VLQNGTFQCSTCDPKINVKADGTDRPIQGSKEIDTVAVKIVDDKTVETTSKKGGRVVESAKNTISVDGKTDTVEFTFYPEASKQPVTGKETLIRVGAGPSGSHTISGSWRIQKANASENALTFTYKSSPDGLMMTDAIGESFDAKFDGKDYPIKGATGYTVSLTKVNDRAIIETDKRDGKVVAVTHMTVSADGKTLTIKSENKVQGTTTTFAAAKQ
jgi:WD40 repeat protein